MFPITLCTSSPPPRLHQAGSPKYSTPHQRDPLTAKDFLVNKETFARTELLQFHVYLWASIQTTDSNEDIAYFLGKQSAYRNLLAAEVCEQLELHFEPRCRPKLDTPSVELDNTAVEDLELRLMIILPTKEIVMKRERQNFSRLSNRLTSHGTHCCLYWSHPLSSRRTSNSKSEVILFE